MNKLHIKAEKSYGSQSPEASDQGKSQPDVGHWATSNRGPLGPT
jgi:hypothetical protein